MIPSTERFSDNNGRNKIKATIGDSQQGFIFRSNSIHSLHDSIKQLRTSYFYSDLTVQPFPIVIGNDNLTLHAFYLYFENSFYKFDSLIDCIDTCFKLFHVLNLEYPKLCNGVWLYIQKYFYEIQTQHDTQISTSFVSKLLKSI